jgi:hypothetical protein
MGTETIHYQDGGHADRTATLEREGDSVTLVVGDRRVPLDIETRDPGGGIFKGVTTDIAHISYALLGLFKHWGRSYGDRIGFEWAGRRAIALYQEHPADAGKNYAHPGVTLLEPTGAESAPPGAPGPAASTPQEAPPVAESGGATAVDFGVAVVAAVAGVVLFAAAISGVGAGASNALSVFPHNVSTLDKKLKTFLRSSRAYRLYLSEGTWLSGGCWLLAEALRQVLGGELVALTSTNGVEHVALEADGWIVDGDGFSRRDSLLWRWAEQERVARPQLVPFSSVELEVYSKAEIPSPDGRLPLLVADLRRVLAAR